VTRLKRVTADAELMYYRLFDKRGAIFSSRPKSYVANDLMGLEDIHLLAAPYGATYRKLRKVYQQLMTPNIVDSLLPIQDAESTMTVLGLLNAPDRYYDHIRDFPQPSFLLQSSEGGAETLRTAISKSCIA
jgi:hypothetical protein